MQILRDPRQGCSSEKEEIVAHVQMLGVLLGEWGHSSHLAVCPRLTTGPQCPRHCPAQSRPWKNLCGMKATLPRAQEGQSVWQEGHARGHEV